jgi:hypothetical protein
MGIHVVSALPQARNTSHNALAAPPQTGSSKIAMMSLIHFGTRGRLTAEMQGRREKTLGTRRLRVSAVK